ncbi:hypothetical protein [Lacicoccus qingdaonensis]|uniref:Uncharacterized protein n=1 Tax=Lacicoccus qingdaonensis TaxID=576118 RepID=A0A1G9I865_9BACL|nr:hypothetical protein [Salinicoccus qingdaonensis]SDL21447.1 hypothetical protein SAMN05216216_1318 [Salinicoccus qingdaonensis]
MEALLPLLIFAGGVIYSVIASKGDKSKGKRNIDPSKMERPGRAAPRRRPANNEPEREQSGGLFDELKREFKKEYDKTMGEPETETKSQSRKMSQENIKRRVEEERQNLEDRRQREKQRPSMRQRSQNKTYEDKKPVERRQPERASRARDSVYTGAHDAKDDVEVAGSAEGIGREITERARYTYGDERTEMHERDKKKSEGFTSRDLTFDRKAVVNGIIFNEILGKPKSKR